MLVFAGVGSPGDRGSDSRVAVIKQGLDKQGKCARSRGRIHLYVPTPAVSVRPQNIPIQVVADLFSGFAGHGTMADEVRGV
jgi:hypothetical protein